ncbi:MAG: ATP phosphoribosyltransferase [Bacillota bacterium]|uniref:ATP phosphoribosyltransferase n=1 Tax=Thermanaerosceptrum fracticalcis TaxID=1712410 RepID=A0A7G6E6H4_THEFR|nr:ATP phosphoribosyltransferase [Thermanaerosceptrum fracticalcis]QNB47678.1 ATP phosphoribosyltransferase [Thermanaerosceptrum fracticalcis]
METKLTIALPKGKLFAPSIELLSQCGFNCAHFSDEARTLVFTDEKNQTSFIICRPTDIPTYVEYGAADLGIVGKDSIMEAGKNLYELVDLKYGYCRFVVAAPRSVLSPDGEYQWKAGLRIATKFPTIAKEFVKRKGLHAEIIKLHGNIELAPRVGLAELIIDIVSTGKTLQENNLVPLEEIGSATARLVVNRASYRLKSEAINHIVSRMKEILQQEGGSP